MMFYYDMICVVCGKEWAYATPKELVEPVDIKNRFIVICNILFKANTFGIDMVSTIIHEPNEVSTAWRQLYSRVKNLGEENKVE